MIDLERYGRTDGVGRNELEGRLRHAFEAIASMRLDRDLYLDNLTATQKRCTELLDQARALKLQFVQDGCPKRLIEVFAAVVTERYRQDIRWGAVDTLLEIPFGTGDSWAEVLADVRREVSEHQTETGRGTCCWAHVLLEETVETLAESQSDNIELELVQVAAVAVKALEILHAQRVKSLEPLVVSDTNGNPVETIHP